MVFAQIALNAITETDEKKQISFLRTTGLFLIQIKEGSIAELHFFFFLGTSPFTCNISLEKNPSSQ